MKPKFTKEHLDWLRTYCSVDRDQIIMAFAVAMPLSATAVSRLKADEVCTNGAPKNFVPIIRRRRPLDPARPVRRDIGQPLHGEVGQMSAAYVASRTTQSEWLFPRARRGHVSADEIDAIIDRCGLLGECGSEGLRRAFGFAVHHAHGRIITPELRREDRWLWTNDDVVAEVMGSMSLFKSAPKHAGPRPEDEGFWSPFSPMGA